MADHQVTPFNAADDPEWRDLEQRLHGLAGQVHFPPTPDLAGATRRLLTKSPPQTVAVRWWPRLVVATALLIVIAATVLALVAPAREAVARWLDFPGVSLLTGDDEPPVTHPAPVRNGLGEQTSLDSILAAAGFSIESPQAAGLSEPDEHYLLEEGEAVVFIYLTDEGLPAITGSDVGLLLMQFRASPDSIWIEKQLGQNTAVDVVRVNEAESLWIEGSHTLVLNPAGMASPAARPTANVLIWNQNGTTYRIEANLSQSAMIGIAESMQPVSS